MPSSAADDLAIALKHTLRVRRGRGHQCMSSGLACRTTAQIAAASSLMGLGVGWGLPDGLTRSKVATHRRAAVDRNGACAMSEREMGWPGSKPSCLTGVTLALCAADETAHSFSVPCGQRREKNRNDKCDG